MPDKPAAPDNKLAMRNLATRNIRHMVALMEDALSVLDVGDTVSAVEYLEVIRDSLDAEIPRLRTLNATR